MLKIAVTGHRPQRLDNAYDIQHPVNQKLSKVMFDFILKQAGYSKETKKFQEKKVKLVTGMALGADTVWALVAIKLKESFPNVFMLECVIPCAEHSKKFPEKSQKIYNYILENADTITYSSKEPYKPWLMQKRNEYMVDITDVVFAVWDGVEKGGTWNCVSYALKENSVIYKFYPLRDKTWEKYHN